MKTCVLHINERLIEGNSQEERFVVVFRLLSFNSFFKNKNNNKKQSKTDPKYYSDCIWSDCLSVWIFCLIGFIFLFFFVSSEELQDARLLIQSLLSTLQIVAWTDLTASRKEPITFTFRLTFVTISLVLLKEKITSNRALSVVWFRNLFHRHSRSWKWTSRRKLEIWRRTCWILYQVFH